LIIEQRVLEAVPGAPPAPRPAGVKALPVVMQNHALSLSENSLPVSLSVLKVTEGRRCQLLMPVQYLMNDPRQGMKDTMPSVAAVSPATMEPALLLTEIQWLCIGQ
jgi:hypothetical protein